MMIDLKRRPLWVGPFNEVLDDMRRKPFDWETNDCACQFAGRIVEVLTGENLYSEFDGSYHDAASAYRVMRAAGFTDLADMVATYLREYEHPSEAQIGDIMAIPVHTPFGHGLGVLNGERIFTLGQNGIDHIDRAAAARAFRVG